MAFREKIFIFLGIFLIAYSLYTSFAQKLHVSTIITKIPTARILDFSGSFNDFTVNGNSDGWQERALSSGDVVCCNNGEVIVALDKTATNIATLYPGACLTINETDGNSVDNVYQNTTAGASDDTGEILFDINTTLLDGSSFVVDTPTGTVGVSGTVFYVRVNTGTNPYTEVVNLNSTQPITFRINNDGDGISPEACEGGSGCSLFTEDKAKIVKGANNTGPTHIDYTSTFNSFQGKNNTYQQAEPLQNALRYDPNDIKNVTKSYIDGIDISTKNDDAFLIQRYGRTLWRVLRYKDRKKNIIKKIIKD